MDKGCEDLCHLGARSGDLTLATTVSGCGFNRLTLPLNDTRSAFAVVDGDKANRDYFDDCRRKVLDRQLTNSRGRGAAVQPQQARGRAFQ